MRVLVTGGGGLLGGRLATLLSAEHRVTVGYLRSPPPAGLAAFGLDLLAEASLSRALEAARPEAIVHCAALADVDRCEADPEWADNLNVYAPFALARACRRLGVRLIAISTDLVLAGDRAFTDESHPPEPRLVYGRSKLAGERAVLAECPDAAIARVALVHGRGHGPRPTASEAIAWSLKAGRTVGLYLDQHRTPIDPESVTLALLPLLKGTQCGVFHLGGAERLSRYEVGVRVARLLGLADSLIEPVRQADRPHGVARPADVSLDTSRARRELGWEPRPLDAGLRDGRPAPDN